MTRYLPLIALLLVPCLAVAADESEDGCDAARWAEWGEIISEMSGDPVELADARATMQVNRQVCEQMAAGTLDADAANERYEAARTAWIQRVRQRQIARDSASGRTEAL